VVSVRKIGGLSDGVPTIARAIDRLANVTGSAARSSRWAARRMRSVHARHPLVLDGADAAAQFRFSQDAAVIRSARVAIGMRLHALILAARFAVPFLAIPYDPKWRRSARISNTRSVRFGLPARGCRRPMPSTRWWIDLCRSGTNSRPNFPADGGDSCRAERNFDVLGESSTTMSETAERNYRDTLNLPKTGFP